ncbi:hypothetical protein TTHERM_00637440 (macronuclear) [Tetrahymena thermophila SB210]|uniref:Uncharacterized protein n=1 Tax=Tetrahymena thermophila (strain SB210) TaxID=312017 RepID=Q22HF9_TETTS|nr:hypothetical protein TTHERM_00637440 [Tetrahymena thermophila SB210]EAR84742.2 hypothetical protein TTHERM_00637440 [Tetrahymena thermophila SB210]|eukprot:XP_001032405.2 hypothetical protein TTHERM_00637440 [Tetrahymena thermophila SB210]
MNTTANNYNSLNNKNYAALYSLAANALNQSKNESNQKVQNQQEHTGPPQLTNLNITPYIPKIISRQNYQESSNIDLDQTKSQDNQKQHKRVNTYDGKQNNQIQEQKYNYDYMNMVNNSNQQNFSKDSQAQLLNINKNNQQYLQLQNNYQNYNLPDTIQSSRTPAFVFSNSSLTSPQQGFGEIIDVQKNAQQFQSPQDVEDSQNNKNQINFQSNKQDLNLSGLKTQNLNDQLSQQDLQFINIKSPQSNQQNILQYQNNSIQSLPNSYYFNSQATTKNYSTPKEQSQHIHFTPQQEIQSILKYSEAQTNNSRVGQNYVQSCTNSPSTQKKQTQSSKRQEKPIKSLNVSHHNLEDFQQQQQEVLNEQQRQLNQQIKKIQSLQNSFIQFNENQNDNSNQSMQQTSRIIFNNQLNQLQSSYRKEDYLGNLQSNENNFDIEANIQQMNDIWAKIQVAVKTKIIKQQNQTEDTKIIDQLSIAKQQLQIYGQELKFKEQQTEKYQKENEQLKQQIQNLTDKISYLSENVSGFQSEQLQIIKSLQNKLIEKENFIVNLQLQLKKKQKLELNTSRSERDNEILHLKQLLVQKTDVITDLKIKNQMLKEEIVQLGQTQVQKENSYPEQGQINQKKKEYSLLKQKVNLLEEDIKRFNDEINLK